MRDAIFFLISIIVLASCDFHKPNTAPPPAPNKSFIQLNSQFEDLCSEAAESVPSEGYPFTRWTIWVRHAPREFISVWRWDGHSLTTQGASLHGQQYKKVGDTFIAIPAIPTVVNDSQLVGGVNSDLLMILGMNTANDSGFDNANRGSIVTVTLPGHMRIEFLLELFSNDKKPLRVFRSFESIDSRTDYPWHKFFNLYNAY